MQMQLQSLMTWKKYDQKCKLKLQEMILLEKSQGRKLGKLEFAAFDGKKKKPSHN